MHSALEKAREILGDATFPACESASLRLEKFVQLGENSKAGEIKAVMSKTPGRIPSVTPRGAIRFVAKLGGRLIVNQAGGILENAGLCLHRHFNAPYIPGSAVKGCARHAAWQAWNDTDEGEQKVAAAKEVAEIFGFPTGDKNGLDKYLEEKCGYGKAQAGKVAFLAAVPETTAPLVADVVTCHHPDYYAGRFPEALDCESPIPNVFPAVREGSRFVFTVAPYGADADLLSRARHWLVVAMTENGMGAKTAAGYGWFVYDESAELAKEARLEQERIAKEAEARRQAEEAAAKAKTEAARAARASLPVLEQWAGSGGAAAACGKEGKTFLAKWKDAGEASRDEVVAALQQAEGLGHDVWLMLRTDKKRKSGEAVSAVCKWCKERKLGKMPQ